MYFDHTKRSYYRFPSKNSVTELDTQMPYYCPEKETSQVEGSLNLMQNNVPTSSIVSSSNLMPYEKNTTT